MIIVKGLRRTGKSSLMRVALNEAELPYIFIDLRLTTPNFRGNLRILLS